MIKIITQLPQLANLTHLDLSGMNVEDEGARVLASLTRISKLEYLWLTGKK